jgi:hypothetical protein
VLLPGMRKRRTAHLRVQRIAFQEDDVLHGFPGAYALIEPADWDA